MDMDTVYMVCMVHMDMDMVYMDMDMYSCVLHPDCVPLCGLRVLSACLRVHSSAAPFKHICSASWMAN